MQLLKTTSLFRSFVQPCILNSSHLDDVNIGLETIPHLSVLLYISNFSLEKTYHSLPFCPQFPPFLCLVFLCRWETAQVTNVQQQSRPRTQASKMVAWLDVVFHWWMCGTVSLQTHGMFDHRINGSQVYSSTFYDKNQPNVGIFTIYGSYGLLCCLQRKYICGRSIIKWHVTCATWVGMRTDDREDFPSEFYSVD